MLDGGASERSRRLSSGAELQRDPPLSAITHALKVTDALKATDICIFKTNITRGSLGGSDIKVRICYCS